MKPFGIALMAIILTSAGFGQAVWSPAMQIRVKNIANVRVSPDAARVLYTVANEVMTDDKSEYVNQVWMATTDGKENRQLTFGEKTSINPKWSSDGKWIAFTSTRKDSKSNLFVLPTAGGEAVMITDVRSGVIDFEWSPDSKTIAFTMTDAKTVEEEKNDKARNDFRWVDENIKMTRLYTVPLIANESGKREVRKLTPADRSVTGFNWSPDGHSIVYNHVSTPSPNDWPSADISAIDLAADRLTSIASTPAAESALTYSPDGKWIAGIASDSSHWAQSYTIRAYPAGGGPPRVFDGSYDSQPSVIGWSADGTRIYFYEAKGTGTALYYVDVESGRITLDNYADGAVTGVNFNPPANAIGMVMQKTNRAPEAFVVKMAERAPVQVSHANDEFASMPVGKTEVIKWKSKDGREIEGLLTYPYDYKPGTKVPFILNVHGGPAGVFNQSYIGNRGVYPIATFASRGYAILRANPRGSSGYGTEFRRANRKDWGGMDYEDLMSGVDKVIEMGVADPNRLGVMGWSYGGYMTSTIITKTKRFKAASAGAPVTNLMSFNGTADIPAFVPDYFGGQAWEIPEVYAKHSAMFNIKGVTTPTLIEQGDADLRVPISQGYELYNALKQQGVPTRMIVLPRQPHGPNEPKMQIAAMQANLDWFEKYLK